MFVPEKKKKNSSNKMRNNLNTKGSIEEENMFAFAAAEELVGNSTGLPGKEGPWAADTGPVKGSEHS